MELKELDKKLEQKEVFVYYQTLWMELNSCFLSVYLLYLLYVSMIIITN